MDRIHQIFDLFYKNKTIPLCILKNEIPVLSYPFSDGKLFPKSFTDIFLNDFRNMGYDRTHPQIVMLTPPSYLGIAELEEDTHLILGPAIPYQHSLSEISAYMDTTLYQDNKNSFSILLTNMQPVSYLDFMNALELAIYMFNGLILDLKYLYFDMLTTHTDNVQKNLVKYQFNRQEVSVFHTPQDLELDISKAIEDGNVSSLKKYMQKPASEQLGVLSLNQERQIRYMFVTVSAVFARAAMRGGLNYETACSTADIYCQQMDRIKNPTEITLLQDKMMFDFASKVASIKKYKSNSPVIQKCIEYIDKHLHYPIFLQELSAACNLSPNRLSSKFKKEIGLSIVDYIHTQKMEEALHLLRFSDYSISEISSYLGYSNQSYFSAVFKKIYHQTPLQVKNQKHL